MKIKGSHIIAVLLAVGIAYWMLTGDIRIGGQSESGEGAPAIAERESKSDQEKFKVRYVQVNSQSRQEHILVRGKTKADSIVTIRAETGGLVQERFVDKGQRVSKGDLVCKIEDGARRASLAQAKAQLEQAETEYAANKKLQDKGFASANKLTALKAAVDAAMAAVAAADQELGRVEVRANADGIVQDPMAEIGDVLSPGGACITLIDTDPMLFSGQVSERDIGKINPGMPAGVKLITGRLAPGKIRYIAASADAKTRTFEVEIEIDAEQHIRDGMTAEAIIELDAEPAFLLSPSWVTLDDDGTIGIRIIKDDNMVDFVPVTILAQTKEGFWVSGPKAGHRVITLGQEYVVVGETVDGSADTRGEGAAANNTASESEAVQ